MKTYRGAHEWIHVFFTLALVGVEWSALRTGHFTQGTEVPVPIAVFSILATRGDLMLYDCSPILWALWVGLCLVIATHLHYAVQPICWTLASLPIY
jgi:hypothetical protein